MRVVSGFVAGMVLLAGAMTHAAAPSLVANAVMKRDRAAVAALIAQKSDVNAPQADGANELGIGGYRRRFVGRECRCGHGEGQRDADAGVYCAP